MTLIEAHLFRIYPSAFRLGSFPCPFNALNYDGGSFVRRSVGFRRPPRRLASGRRCYPPDLTV
jgi:hypothetical protein